MIIAKFFQFFSTLFYIGNIGFAPGTITSLLTTLFWIYLIPIDIGMRLIIFFLCLLVSYIVVEFSLSLFDDEDPQSIVIDEFIGMSIPMIFIVDSLVITCVAFILFRLLDILKPSIIYYVQGYKGTVGILLDDILCGSLTLLIIINYL